jgi:hypothetical protein
MGAMLTRSVIGGWVVNKGVAREGIFMYDVT